MGTNRDHVLGLLQSRLEGIEARFGGVQKDVPRRAVSRYDKRTPAELARGGMRGGDRMVVHGYSAQYAQHLQPFVQRKGRGMVIVELGVLRGSGLAMLCELFPRAERIIGLDVDTSHFREHRTQLERLGAFRRRAPEVHAFDELAPDAAMRLAGILAGDRIDVFIHDALHYDAAIIATMAHVSRHWRRTFRCFVEDNATVGPALGKLYGSRCAVEQHGRLTVLWGDA
jgi:hypothetical protein